MHGDYLARPSVPVLHSTSHRQTVGLDLVGQNIPKIEDMPGRSNDDRQTRWGNLLGRSNVPKRTSLAAKRPLNPLPQSVDMWNRSIDSDPSSWRTKRSRCVSNVTCREHGVNSFTDKKCRWWDACDPNVELSDHKPMLRNIISTIQKTFSSHKLRYFRLIPMR